ncbi:MAG TPA: DUF4465 domain-containing protein [Crocinitomicaceae bacterium]|nr:DUF4465 domain-containing protein [Crocinitomicaceae bacterium]
MKKIYILTTALFLGANINAQPLIDFESYNLPAAIDTFYNGADGSGDFTIAYATFSNVYDAQWGSWTGFSVSNMTDTLTPGWGNQYSCIVGEGAANSSNYGVFNSEGEITVNANIRLQSFSIANTTYATISMQEGDSFAKKFGDSLGADGLVDGTNGEDFLKVWIIAEDLANTNKDSIEYFLADYRFADSTQDYILKTWDNVDLTSFPFDVQKITFRMESSDNSFGYMNTPAYFAIDNIQGASVSGIDESEKISFSTYPNPVKKTLTVTGDNGTISLFDVNGKLIMESVHSGESKIDMTNLDKGIYLLKLENATGVATQRIIK